jgi:DNA-binding NtrC family response regulator
MPSCGRRRSWSLRRNNAHGSAPRFTVAEGGLREIGRRGARQAECEALREVLERVSGNRAKAARILKVSYKTLLNRISECGLTSSPRC